MCKTAQSASPYPVRQTRERLDKAVKQTGEVLQVRKDVDSLQKQLADAGPASVSFFRDKLQDNSRVAYEITIGRVFNTALYQNEFDGSGRARDIPVTLIPYVRFVGQDNTHPSKTKSDVENWAAGIRSDFLMVPLGNLDNAFSLRAEYLTDAEASTTIAAGELVWEPILRSPSGILTALQGQYFPLGAEGPYLTLDLTGRLRFGEVFDPGEKPALLAQSEYVRLGGKAAGKIGFGGSDFLSGLSVSAIYWHFETVHGFGGSFSKLQGLLQYDITQNFGFATKFTKGTDEDKLDRIHQYEAAFTVKF